MGMNSLDDKTNGLGFKSLVALTAFSTSGTKEGGGLMKPGKKREKPMSALEEIMRKDELAKDQIKKKKVAPDDILATGSLKNVDEEEEPWLHENILVKVMTKDLGPNYYKKKGKVLTVENKYEAIVQMVNSAHSEYQPKKRPKSRKPR